MSCRSVAAATSILCTLVVSAAALRAGDAVADNESLDEVLARLQETYEAQQKRLAELAERAAVSGAQDVDAARVEAMRQQIREVLSDQKFRESLMPTTMLAGYNNGFYIRSSDDAFLMKVNGVIQSRFTHYGTGSTNRYLTPGVQRDDRTGFDVQRLRVMLSGNVHSPDLTYNITMRADAPDGYQFKVHYAYANYRFIDEFQFQAGIFRVASTRVQMHSDANFQMIDRPMSDAVFGLGIGTGVRFWGQCANKHIDYYIDVVNSLSSPVNQTITNTDPGPLDDNPAVLFRTVWHALGENLGKDFIVEPDLPKHKSPAVDLGFHYAFNQDDGDLNTLRIPVPLTRAYRSGGFGLVKTTGLQISQFGWDANFKLRGFSAAGEYYFRIVDPVRAGRYPYAPWWLASGDGSTTVQQGGYVQAGYFLPIPGLEDKLEVVARVDGISALASVQAGAWEYTAGVNYYIKGTRVKLQSDVVKVTQVPISNNPSSLAVVNDDALIFRVQFQVAF